MSSVVIDAICSVKHQHESSSKICMKDLRERFAWKICVEDLNERFLFSMTHDERLNVVQFLRVCEANEVPISSHMYMGRLDDIQTALKPLKII